MPVLAKTVAGFYQGIDPVAVVPVLQTAEMHRAIAETIARGNPVIPTPSPKEIPLPSMLKYAGVKTWKTFDREATCWKITEKRASIKSSASGMGAMAAGSTITIRLS